MNNNINIGIIGIHNIKRKIQLGQAKRIENADNKGSLIGFNLNIGYDLFLQNNLVLAPLLKFNLNIYTE